jgi:hypothetical protein
MTLTEPAGPVSTEVEPAANRADRAVLCPAPGDADAREQVRRRLARIAALAAPHLCPLRRIHESSEGFWLTYDVPTGATTWADLAQRRTPSVAETVGVGLAICLALQPLHAVGLAHGAVTADRLLIGPYGTVELTDAGAVAAGTGRGGPAASADVTALAALVERGLPAGSVGSDLALLLVRAADPDGSLRPTVAELAIVLERQCSPEPVQLVVGDASPGGALSPPAPQRSRPDPAADASAVLRTLRDGSPAGTGAPAGRHRAEPEGERSWRRATGPVIRVRGRSPGRARQLLLVGALVLGLVLMTRGAAGLLRERPVADVAPTVVSTRPDPTAPDPAPSTAAPSDAPVADWSAVLRRLDEGRAAAMAAGSATALAEAVDPDGPAFARDLATLRARQAAGLRVEGGGLSVRAVRAEETGAGRVTIDVTDERATYRLLDADGAVVLSVPARPLASWEVVLTGHDSGWRIYDATRVG